jgi:outer membrane lipoprotein-sorting protein
MIQPGGQNSITLRILRVEWNAAIPERLFEHNPPKGTPVVQVGAAGTFTDK